MSCISDEDEYEYSDDDSVDDERSTHHGDCELLALESFFYETSSMAAAQGFIKNENTN
jgi:hypothetical protein